MNIKNTFCTIFIPNSTFDYLIDKIPIHKDIKI